MKKFLFKTIIFLFLSSITFLAFIVAFENNKTVKTLKYSMYINQYNIILEKIKNYNQRKIIFLGGSNVGFGLNSKRIENSLGVKTFNFGVHGGKGTKKKNR